MVAVEEFPRDRLLALTYEHMLLGMLSNQATLPQTLVAGGSFDDLNEVAIDLWMGASPVYTRRMRRLMGIEGDDVPAIMKGLQLDVGFVHQYMNVQYQVNSPHDGEFWLEHCGALMNLEPQGEAAVIGMCHTIEDPTFDATAYATNPRARIRPVHRPPRVPPDRTPHCHWTIRIEAENEPVGPARLTRRIGGLPLASLSNEPRPAGEGYQGPFDPKFGLSACSDATLRALAREFSVQTHLLMCAADVALAERYGVERARELLADAWLASAWASTERLRDTLEISDVGSMLMAHPAIPPGFARSVSSEESIVRLELRPESPALLAVDQPGWIGALVRGETRGLQGIVQALNARARVSSVVVRDGRVVATVNVDESAPLLEEPEVLAFMRVGMLSTWKFHL